MCDSIVRKYSRLELTLTLSQMLSTTVTGEPAADYEKGGHSDEK